MKTIFASIRPFLNLSRPTRFRLSTLFPKSILLAALAVLPNSPMMAQTHTVLHHFAGCPDGAGPEAALTLVGNTLYGTTGAGGLCENGGYGTVFKVNTDGTGYAVLKSFVRSDGSHPRSQLVASGTALYGTTMVGGAQDTGCGTVFRMGLDGSNHVVLHDFNLFIPCYVRGINPNGPILSGGTLYGTTQQGGSSAVCGSFGGYGTVFMMDTNGVNHAILHSFNYADGSNPIGELVSDGNTLYGTTYQGGAFDKGTVFKINTDGTGFTNLHHFSGTDGERPFAGLTLSGNSLYGTTRQGLASRGTVFKVNTDGTGFTNLHHFAGGSGGADPCGTLVLRGNTLYGVTPADYAGNLLIHRGMVFKINIDGTGFGVVHSFSGDDGQIPLGGLVSSGNVLYGTTSGGGTNGGGGTAFSLTLPPPRLAIVPSGADVVLTWPTDATGFIAQASPTVAPSPNWTDLTNVPVITGAIFSITLPVTDATRFFRLRSP